MSLKQDHCCYVCVSSVFRPSLFLPSTVHVFDLTVRQRDPPGLIVQKRLAPSGDKGFMSGDYWLTCLSAWDFFLFVLFYLNSWNFHRQHDLFVNKANELYRFEGVFSVCFGTEFHLRWCRNDCQQMCNDLGTNSIFYPMIWSMETV